VVPEILSRRRPAIASRFTRAAPPDTQDRSHLKRVAHPQAGDAPVEAALAAFDSSRAWAMVAAAFIEMFAVYAVAYSFGAFLNPMVAEFGASLRSTSFAFSVTVLLWSMLGPFTGHLTDRLGPRMVLSGGAIVMGTGLVLTAHIHHLWVGYFTYGIAVGVGIACAYVPMVAVVAGWFMRQRNTALGVAVSGVGCGTVFGPPAAAALIQSLGWRTTYEIFGVAAAAVMLACGLLVERPPVHLSGPSSSAQLSESIRSPAFGFLYLSVALLSLALFIPFVYLPSYAQDHGASEVAAAALVSLIGGASGVGRLGLGALGDRTSVVRLYQMSFLALGLSYGIWLCAGSYAALVMFTLLMGTGYGGYVALAPAVLAHLFGTRRLGTLMGVLWTSTGVGAFAGPPLAGAIIDYTGSYRWAIGFAFAAAMGAFAVLIPLGQFKSQNGQ
jgi:MFS family permease